VTDEVRRPGYYGRVYGDWGTHPKVVGGVLPSGKRCRRLSLAARGMWCSLLSLVIRRKARGVFAAEDAEAEAGAEWAALVSELEANELADAQGDGVWVLHDWASNGASVEKYEENKAKQREWTRESRARKALQGAHVSPDRLDLSPSDIQEERDSEGKGSGKALHVADGSTRNPANLPPRKPVSIDGVKAKELRMLAELVRAEVQAHWRSLGIGPPNQVKDFDWDGWRRIASWLTDTAVGQGWDETEPDWRSTRPGWLVRRFYKSTHHKTVRDQHPITYLATDPTQYAFEAAA
jgi:hypothetical protein